VILQKFVFGLIVAGLVLLGVLGQLGQYLLALSPRDHATDTDSTAAEGALYAAEGPHPVGVRSLTADGEPPMETTVWYPASGGARADGSTTYPYEINMFGPDRAIALATDEGHALRNAPYDQSAGPFPLVVLSPGFAIGSSSYAWLAEHLASHGFVVISPEHDETLDPGVLWRSTIERPRDVLAMLAYVDEQGGSGGDLEGLVDAERVAVIGHSYGGYTALASAGARLDTGAFRASCETARKADDPIVFLCDALLPHTDDMARLAKLDTVPRGLWPARSDPRVDAVVSMAGDAAMFGQEGLGEVSVPVMAIGGTADSDTPFEWGARPTYDHAASSNKVEIAFDGAAHLVFAGECDEARRIMAFVSLGFCSDPAWDRERAHDVVKHYVTAFLLAELSQDQEAAAALAPDGGGFPRVTYRAEGY
jgi:predicted dienelactone hydrolase